MPAGGRAFHPDAIWRQTFRGEGAPSLPFADGHEPRAPPPPRAFLEPEATTAQRLVRARRKLGSTHGSTLPTGDSRSAAIDTVLTTLYLLFNEGYLSTEGDALLAKRLMIDAANLGDHVADLFPFHAEALGLAALLWFHTPRSIDASSSSPARRWWSSTQPSRSR